MTVDIFVETQIPEQKVASAGVPFPAVLSPPGPEATGDLDFDQFLAAVTAHTPRIESLLLSSGAVLLRGFPVKTASDFDRVVTAFGYDEIPYSGAAPRSRVVGRVFTANESPPEQKIPFHHEMAHVPEFPAKLFFFCEEEPVTGGETPIVLSHLIYERMQQKFPEFVRKMEEQGLVYTKFLGDEDDMSSPIGRGWPATFHTNDKTLAEERGRQLSMKLEWMKDGVKTVMGPTPAVRLDKSRGRKIWFNQMAFFSTAYKGVSSDPMKGITFGDGSPLPSEVIDDCLKILEEESVAIPWKKGDILLVDNLAAMHSRRSFTGPRCILASLCK